MSHDICKGHVLRAVELLKSLGNSAPEHEVVREQCILFLGFLGKIVAGL